MTIFKITIVALEPKIFSRMINAVVESIRSAGQID